LNADPDLAFYGYLFNADPETKEELGKVADRNHSNADPDPDQAFHFNTDPDPAPQQKDGNLRPFLGSRATLQASIVSVPRPSTALC
jgi:hypothetical protein